MAASLSAVAGTSLTYNDHTLARLRSTTADATRAAEIESSLISGDGELAGEGTSAVKSDGLLVTLRASISTVGCSHYAPPGPSRELLAPDEWSTSRATQTPFQLVRRGDPTADGPTTTLDADFRIADGSATPHRLDKSDQLDDLGENGLERGGRLLRL